MSKTRLEIKPMSVNRAWQGRRFKTPEYKSYEKAVLLMLPKKMKVPEIIHLKFVFGFKNKLSDIDNPVKLITDILQKKYGFNDSQVYKLEVEKMITKNEFIEVEFKDLAA